ncbi:MAG TPA: hypothetical protein VHE35_00785 [Kofleriaceae bacterium]|nr:hypothetical protein [Kofleriaceae bacterium]
MKRSSRRWTFVIAAALLAAGCAPLETTGQRGLVTDQTPLGTTREEVRSWHLAHDWCAARTWEQSDEYITCSPQVYEGHDDRHIHAFFRYDGDTMVSSAVYVPISCTRPDCHWPLGVSTSLEEPPYVEFKHGLIARPTEAGRATALGITMPADQQRNMDALRIELADRYGQPDWTSPAGTGMTWHTPNEDIGLFLSADGLWTIETHELPQGAPGVSMAP